MLMLIFLTQEQTYHKTKPAVENERKCSIVLVIILKQLRGKKYYSETCL